jgi:Activator of Hsp90 ATPase homolog 1-like protein
MIHKSVYLHCPPARAFQLFTGETSHWWPQDRRHTHDPNSKIQMLSDGRFYERAHDGQEVELGFIHEWDPPLRLVLDFYPGTDPQHPTHVVINFAAEGEGTRLTIDHGPTPTSADLFDLRAPRYHASWDAVLSALLAFI